MLNTSLTHHLFVNNLCSGGQFDESGKPVELPSLPEANRGWKSIHEINASLYDEDAFVVECKCSVDAVNLNSFGCRSTNDDGISSDDYWWEEPTIQD